MNHNLSSNSSVSSQSFTQQSLHGPIFSDSRRPIDTESKEPGLSILNHIEYPQQRSSSGCITKLHTLSILRWWIPEILASSLSVASLLSIILVLRVYDGRGINDLQLPFSLTLNGLIAVISTLNRVFLMVPVSAALSQEAWLWFAEAKQRSRCESQLQDLEISDQASRSPWGSIVLLFHSKFRFVAVFGALISILSLGLGIFAQQLMSIEHFPIQDPGSSLNPGNIPRSESYDLFQGALVWGEVVVVGPTLNMRAAFMSGVMTDSTDAPSATCLTGNCSWPTTPSVAICGGCVPSTYISRQGGGWANYTMPSGSVFNLWIPGAIQFPWTTQKVIFAVMPGRGSYYNSTDPAVLYIANFDVFGAPYNLSQNLEWTSITETPWNNASTVASECALWACVQTYNVSTKSGQQVEKVVSTYSSIFPVPSRSETEDFIFTRIPIDQPQGETLPFNFTFAAAKGLSNYLFHEINGSVDLFGTFSAPSSDTIQAIWSASSNLEAWISNVAASMTNPIRTSAPASQPVFNGTAYQLGIKVRWGWVALPAAMVLCSLIFLIIVIVRTARSKVQSWKGSPLVFLLFDLDDKTRQAAVRQSPEHKGIENAIRKRKALLDELPDGTWTFRDP